MKAYGVVDVQIQICLNSALAGGEWSASRPCRFTPRKDPRYPLDRRLAPEPVWTPWRREHSWPYRDSNSDPSVVQPVASRYTDYAIRPLKAERKRNDYGQMKQSDSLRRVPELVIKTKQLFTDENEIWPVYSSIHVCRYNWVTEDGETCRQPPRLSYS
jgi:hypothetical protein